jgi:hypothetical protein
VLISALRCDRCEDTTHIPVDDDLLDDPRAVMRDAVENDWLVQHTATDHTYGRAVCPLCRMAGYGKDWS